MSTKAKKAKRARKRAMRSKEAKRLRKEQSAKQMQDNTSKANNVHGKGAHHEQEKEVKSQQETTAVKKVEDTPKETGSKETTYTDAEGNSKIIDQEQVNTLSDTIDKANIPPEDKIKVMSGVMSGIANFDSFPTSSEWIADCRRKGIDPFAPRVSKPVEVPNDSSNVIEMHVKSGITEIKTPTPPEVIKERVDKDMGMKDKLAGRAAAKIKAKENADRIAAENMKKAMQSASPVNVKENVPTPSISPSALKALETKLNTLRLTVERQGNMLAKPKQVVDDTELRRQVDELRTTVNSYTRQQNIVKDTLSKHIAASKKSNTTEVKDKVEAKPENNAPVIETVKPSSNKVQMVKGAIYIENAVINIS